MTKKILRWGGVAFLLIFFAYKPGMAVAGVKAIGGGILDIANGFGEFFKTLGT